LLQRLFAKFPDRLNRELRNVIREFEFPDQTFEQGITARRSECDFVIGRGGALCQTAFGSERVELVSSVGRQNL